MRRLFVILFGVVFVAVGVFVFVRGNNIQKRCTEEIVGTVVEIEREISTDSDGYQEYMYYPVIEYKAGEETVTKKYNVGSGNSKYNLEDKVTVLYNPDNVEEYIIKGDKSSNLIGIVFIVLGAVVVVAGFIGKVN